ncbi:MAG: xylose isomerase [Candidatus Limnocylindrales bacterium]
MVLSASSAKSEAYKPTRGDKFTFGLWTVGNAGRDPFGDPTRARLDPNDSVRKLAELGAYGISMHDDDLVPFDATAAERDAIVARFRKTLDDTGMVVAMATTNLFGHPVFKDGAFTSNDRAVRRYAIAKTMRAIDLGAELGAKIYVFWGGREGVEAMAAKRPADALDRYREAMDFLCEYVIDRKYGMRFAMEPKPNEPRGDTFLPTVGHALAFIGSLAHPEMVGLNPETAHETMSGLSFYHAVAQTLWHGKLFHIDLNGQKIGRYDQDLRFGSEEIKDAFFLVKLLEESGYQGPRHFDAHAYRMENAEGVWDFAAGCMRTYLILKEKARRFAADPEIKAAMAAASVAELAEPTVGPYSPEAAAALRAAAGDPGAMAARGYGNERLDQLVMELLMGVR